AGPCCSRPPVQVRQFLRFAGTGQGEISMDLVGHPRAGGNEVLPVVDQKLQIHEQDLPVSRREPFLTRNDPGDGDRIDRVGLALRATMASLPVREGSWNLTNILPA